MLVGLRNETISYGDKTVLASVSLSIEKGERIALLGRSGTGKSTLLAQLYTRLAASEPVVALVPQGDVLVPALSVYHNITMGRLDRCSTIYNLANLIRPWPDDVKEAGTFAESVGLKDALWQTAATLSGGQKQRTVIARAFYRGGPIVLADEPVSAVDVTQGAQILDALRQRFETAIIAMHDVDLALGFATRIVGLKGGQIVFDGPTASIPRGQISDLYAD